MSTSSTTNIRYLIGFDLSEAAPHIYLPRSFVIKTDRHDKPAYLEKRATPDVLASYRLTVTPTLERLFYLEKELTSEAIEQHFSRSRKRPQSLTGLLGEKEVRRAILAYVHRRVAAFIRICAEKDYLLTWHAQRNTRLDSVLIQSSTLPLRPELSFHQHEHGITYTLHLHAGNQRVPLHGQNVHCLTNQPAWILINRQLYAVAHINGFMIKPFVKKLEVQIPAASVSAYFKKFIYKVAAKVDITAEGFEVIRYDRLSACEIEPVSTLFKQHWGLAVHMCYPSARFNWSDKQARATRLQSTDEPEQIAIVQIQRDKAAEAIYLAQLRRHGLVQLEGSYFHLPDADHPEAILQWLMEQRAGLEEMGFTVKLPQKDHKVLALYQPTLELQVDGRPDWFDIHGQVRLGPHLIPFRQIAAYIKREDRYFPLPDDTYFLIPEVWMTRYRELVNFGRFQPDSVRLAKSQHPLLAALDLEVPQLHGDQSALAQDFMPPADLRAELRPYQLDGVRWMVQHYHHELGACLADDMGLGKTLQTIAVLLYAKANKAPVANASAAGAQLGLFGPPAADTEFLRPLNALIVLPASLIYNWMQELRRFAPSLSVYNHTGASRHRDARLLARFDILLTTYQTALRDVELLQKINFEYIVLDESQQIKNRESKIFQAVNRLAGKHKISLSGTPIENSLADLWSQMQFINPDLLGNFRFFKKAFITPIEKHQDEEKKERLRSLVQPYLLRRTKEEVAKDLPALHTQIFYTEMDTAQRKRYEQEKSAARNHLLENFDRQDPQYRILVLQALTKLRQIANHPRLIWENYERSSGKFHDVLAHWSIIRKAGHKALFFSSFVRYLELFKQHFQQQGHDIAWLTGQLTPRERQLQVQRFEEQDEVRAFLISIKAGGTGLNLTAADYVFILDPWWNPTVEQQAIARAHRIGQDKQVIALKFITRDSIEEKILQLQEQKAQLAEDIIGKSTQLAFSREELEFLLV